jgi:membrane-bound lytic murein transglycosylase D
MKRLLTLCVVLAFSAGCVHKDLGQTTAVGNGEARGGNSADANSTGLNQAAAKNDESEIKDISSFRLSDPEGPKVLDQELESIPTEINPLVEKWITYFQGRGREHMEKYLARSSRYEKLMKKVLRDNGLPEDLFYIALIESGFSSQATSHAAAVGFWQFIRGTGKRYGLEINPFVDERRDPVFATQAAAEYFKGLYSVFGSWYLAMASYNVGENRVKREVMNHYTRDFWELARKKRLPQETINYVPKFIAAKLIAKDPEKFGFEGIDYLPPIEFDHISVVKPTNLRQMAEKLNVNYEDFKALNPKFKGEVAPLKGTELVLRIPPGMNDAAVVAANSAAVDQVQFVADSGDTTTYKIRRGDNLKTIARRYRTSVAYIRDLNDLPRKSRLKVGMKIYVPDRSPLRTRGGAKGATAVAQVEEKQGKKEKQDNFNGPVHVVKSGESLYSIAIKYQITVSQLKQLNNIKRSNKIKLGMKMKLPANISSNGPSARELAKTRIHIVQKGEKLTEIAARYNVMSSVLQEKNKIRNPTSLAVGSKIFIPQTETSH